MMLKVYVAIQLIILMTKFEAPIYNIFLRNPVYKFSMAKFAKGNNSKKKSTGIYLLANQV